MLKTAKQWMTKTSGRIKNSRHIGKSTYLQYRNGQFRIFAKGQVIQKITGDTLIDYMRNDKGQKFYVIVE